MPKLSTYSEKTPVESTDKLAGVDGSDAVRLYSTDDIKEFVSLPYITASTDGDDRGLNFSEQISVGAPDAGRESVFGEGDSYPVPIAYHCDIANTTGMVITSAIDASTTLQSDSGSTTGLFNGTTDGVIITGLLPEGIDTSIPVLLYVDWYAKDDTAGDVELELELVVATEDFVYDGTATKSSATPSIVTLGTSQYKRQTSIFKVLIQAALPGDTVYGSLYRDASSGNADDTYSSNIVITAVNVIGYFWKP